MKRGFLLIGFLMLVKISAQTWTTEEQYIQRFAQYAVEEMEKYKIPASITLAQGILETGGGQSRLAREGNNHFGIKCKNEWTGRKMYHTDDAPNECFRVYDNPRESYEDHSKFLAFRPYYKNLFTLDPKDYKAWAHGLKKAGYATHPKYAQILINKIEKHHLDEFDHLESKQVVYALLKKYPELNNDAEFIASMGAAKKSQTIAKTEPRTEPKVYNRVVEVPKSEASKVELLDKMLIKNHPNGDRKYIIATADTDVDYISQKYGVRKARLIKYNDLETENIAKNDIIFLENKANSGNVKTYKSKGETMHQIAQKFAIRLKKLYKKNDMAWGSQPTIGQVIKLK